MLVKMKRQEDFSGGGRSFLLGKKLFHGGNPPQGKPSTGKVFLPRGRYYGTKISLFQTLVALLSQDSIETYITQTIFIAGNRVMGIQMKDDKKGNNIQMYNCPNMKMCNCQRENCQHRYDKVTTKGKNSSFLTCYFNQMM